MKPTFFSDQAAFRAWLKTNHKNKNELWVGFYKVKSGLPSMTWSESVDQALCYGWIDGLRKSIDEKSYMIRFTPRKAKSNWSAVNIKKIAKLKKARLMRKAGLDAFEKRDEKYSEIYAFEQQEVTLDDEYLSKLKDSRAAWKYYENSPPSYQKQTTWWIMSAKREDTRERRLGILIKHSEMNEKIPQLDWKKKKDK